MKNLFILMILGFLAAQPAKSEPSYPKNCLIVAYTFKESGGLLCIDDLQKLDYRSTHVGDQFNAYFYPGSQMNTPVALIPLKVTEIKPFGLDRYLLDILIYLSGSDGDHQVQIHFSSRVKNGLPVYFQNSDFLKGPTGSQMIQRYIWEESNSIQPPHDCVAHHPGACKI